MGERAEDERGRGRPRQPSFLPQPEHVLLALRRYLRAEQKEQRHTLRHYQHVAAVEPEKAQQMSFQVLKFFQLSNTICYPSDSTLLDPIPQTLFLSVITSFCLLNLLPLFGTPLLCLRHFSLLGFLLPDPGTLPLHPPPVSLTSFLFVRTPLLCLKLCSCPSILLSP